MGFRFRRGGFTLRPDGRRGVLNDGTGLEEQLRWLQPRTLSPPIRLGLERVGAPAWSPDGRAIAVSAAVDVKGVEGVARSIASWRVYLGNSELRSVRPLGNEALEEDPALAWSGDSRAFHARRRARGRRRGTGRRVHRDSRRQGCRRSTRGIAGSTHVVTESRRQIAPSVIIHSLELLPNFCPFELI
jgi:hypothetical protein